jgi:hypothetical protein
LDLQTPKPLSRLELAMREVEQLGLHLTCLPGEYCVNYIHGSVATARFAENLEDAIREGHDLIKKAPKKMQVTPSIRQGRPITLKAIRRCKILSHNHRARALWIKKRQ